MTAGGDLLASDLGRASRTRTRSFSPAAAVPVVVLVGVIFLSFIGFSPIAITGAVDPQVAQAGDGDSLRQVSFVLLLALIIGHVCVVQGARALLRVPGILVLSLGWCWLSLAWAIDVGTGSRRVIFTNIVILSVTYAVRSMSYQRVFNTLVTTFAAILVADWVSIALFPYAVHQANEVESLLAGNWRGLHDHKNEAGAFCALCMMLFSYASWRARSFVIGPALILLAVGFLAMSQSKTSGGFVFVAMLVGLFAVVGYRNPTFRTIVLISAGIAALFLYASIPQKGVIVNDLLNDPAAFTGRAQIWQVMVQYITDHPWRGSGYGSFWAIGPLSPVLAYGDSWITTVYQAHNGYLNLAAQIGVPGLALATFMLVVYPVWVLCSKRLRPGFPRWLVCSILVFGALHDILESSLLDRSSITWVTLVIFYALIADARDAVLPPASKRSFRLL